MLLELNSLTLLKAIEKPKGSITRTQAKGVHKDLPPGGVWRTIHGHHVYIKNGKVLAGSIPGVTKPRKATKAHIKDYQEHIDKEGAKDDSKKTKKATAPAKKPTAKPKTAPAKSKISKEGKAVKQVKQDTKEPTVKKAPAKKAPAKKAKEEPVKQVKQAPKKTPAKKTTEAPKKTAPAKKAPAKKAPAKQATEAPKKTAPAKKEPAKKAPEKAPEAPVSSKIVSASNAKKMMARQVPPRHRDALLNTLKHDEKLFTFSSHANGDDIHGKTRSKGVVGKMYKEHEVQQAIEAYKKSPGMGIQFDAEETQRRLDEAARVKEQIDREIAESRAKEAEDARLKKEGEDMINDLAQWASEAVGDEKQETPSEPATAPEPPKPAPKPKKLDQALKEHAKKIVETVMKDEGEYDFDEHVTMNGAHDEFEQALKDVKNAPDFYDKARKALIEQKEISKYDDFDPDDPDTQDKLHMYADDVIHDAIDTWRGKEKELLPKQEEPASEPEKPASEPQKPAQPSKEHLRLKKKMDNMRTKNIERIAKQTQNGSEMFHEAELDLPARDELRALQKIVQGESLREKNAKLHKILNGGILEEEAAPAPAPKEKKPTEGVGITKKAGMTNKDLYPSLHKVIMDSKSYMEFHSKLKQSADALSDSKSLQKRGKGTINKKLNDLYNEFKGFTPEQHEANEKEQARIANIKHMEAGRKRAESTIPKLSRSTVELPPRKRLSEFGDDMEAWEKHRDARRAAKDAQAAEMEDYTNKLLERESPFRKAEDAHSYLRAMGVQHPGFEGVDPRIMGDVLNGVTRVLSKYPKLKINFLGTSDNYEKHLEKNGGKGAYTNSTTKDMVGDNTGEYVGDRSVTFNTRMFGNYKNLASEFMENVQTGHTVQGSGTPENLIIHELGHIMQYGSGYDGYDAMAHDITESPSTKMRDDFDKLRQKYHAEIPNHVSGYATTNDDEFFAEAFTNHITGHNADTPLMKEFGALMDKHFSYLKEDGSGTPPQVESPVIPNLQNSARQAKDHREWHQHIVNHADAKTRTAYNNKLNTVEGVERGDGEGRVKKLYEEMRLQKSIKLRNLSLIIRL